MSSRLLVATTLQTHDASDETVQTLRRPSLRLTRTSMMAGCVRITADVRTLLREQGKEDVLDGAQLHAHSCVVSHVKLHYFDVVLPDDHVCSAHTPISAQQLGISLLASDSGVDMSITPTPSTHQHATRRESPTKSKATRQSPQPSTSPTRSSRGSNPPRTQPSKAHLHTLKWMAGGQKVAVFVSDMSGFTRVTRTHGIVHFVSLLMAMRRIIHPILSACGAIHIRPHADNFFAVFPSTEAAVRAAVWARASLELYCVGKDASNKPRLGGIGISSGPVALLGHELRGPAAMEAFVLGENVADGGEILLSDSARADIFPADEHDRKALHARLFGPGTHATAAARRSKVEGGEPLTFSRLSVSAVPPGLPAVGPCAPYEGPDAHFRTLCLKRLEVASDPDAVAAIDAEIQSKYQTVGAVLMFSLNSFDQLMRAHGAEVAARVESFKTALVAAVIRTHGGDLLEPALAYFSRVDQAVAAAICYQGTIRAHNAKAGPNSKLPLDNVAVHYGRLLYIPQSEVHWGDPVNTASKLAEDVAPTRPRTAPAKNASRACAIM